VLRWFGGGKVARTVTGSAQSQIAGFWTSGWGAATPAWRAARAVAGLPGPGEQVRIGGVGAGTGGLPPFRTIVSRTAPTVCHPKLGISMFGRDGRI
jgi:hypothetical protein